MERNLGFMRMAQGLDPGLERAKREGRIPGVSGGSASLPASRRSGPRSAGRILGVTQAGSSRAEEEQLARKKLLGE